MRTSRRYFAKQMAIASTGLGVIGCRVVDLHQPPTAPTPATNPPPQPPAQPPPRPAAERIASPPTYSFALLANQSFNSVTEAFRAAGVPFEKNGLGKITSIDNRASSSWKIDINAVPFCTDADRASVPAGAIIACYIEDKRKVPSCLSDRPV